MWISNFFNEKRKLPFMKLPSCVGETDQLLTGGPGSIKSHYDFLVYAKTSWLIVFFIEEKDIRYLYTTGVVTEYTRNFVHL